MATLTTLSLLFGYTSIACWLGAQFPQVVENIKRRSCEGLALPFLANWLLGDISNLIGCILTHQLPFQTWLATYFVVVDFTLFGQYFYYQRVNARLYSHPKRTGTTTSRRMSIDRTAPRYRTLSAAAANVAATAALAAEHDELHGHRHSKLHESRDRFTQSSGSRVSRDTPGEEEGLTNLVDSFISEGGLTIGRKQVAWTAEQNSRRGGSVGRYSTNFRTVPSSHTHEPSSSMEAFSSRGRTLQREGSFGVDPLLTSSIRRASKVSRQGSGMVFLSIFAMFSLGTMVHLRSSGSVDESVAHMGRVLSVRSVANAPVFQAAHVYDGSMESASVIHPEIPHTLPADGDVSVSISTSVDSSVLAAPESSERVLGRFFAWLCTTLYLTSRLPQIWKNYDRKSVEGLSMALFVFAFLGNTFYVASILTAPEVFLPPPASTNFLKESIPYLLGSSGTLVFDITIVTQSFLYRPHPHRGSRHSRNRNIEEEARLLADGSPSRTRRNEESVVHSSGRTHSNNSRRTLVIDYLAHSGYTNTARAFGRDSTILHLDMDGEEVPQVEPGSSQLSESSFKQAEVRNQIRLELLSGRVDNATNLLNKYFPSVLSMKDTDVNSIPPSDKMDYVAPTSIHPAHLNLNLRIQAFVERCRTVPLEYPPALLETTPKPEHVGTISLSNKIDHQTELLNGARKLYAYLSMLPSKEDRERYNKELKNVTGLLAYTVPESSSVADYMDQQRRAALADQINYAVLYHSNLTAISRIECYTRYNSTVWSLLNEFRVPLRPEGPCPPTSEQKAVKTMKCGEGIKVCDT
ncbi:hypothetical protein K435DRAFT_821379 [Dendrothele bispora CBS 962.96]|uniref:CRA domain-containing protein n=1 Tax=Dendrothele bispora (strain CBS 962.96) TaxID=1314807 RepID=A0A4S8LHI8_DENBC|nr:hypothetical protein K435DRAFT_821666 [Dendrothele bispora CBS 962.96]THU89547.1 hypothetical protein K435DRAFT_821379 [Dendrothele bispora CBS 962.96]